MSSLLINGTVPTALQLAAIRADLGLGSGTPGAANGVALLDAIGDLPSIQMPNNVGPFGPYTTVALLQAAFPAESNAGKTAYIGVAAPYAQYISNGTTGVGGWKALSTFILGADGVTPIGLVSPNGKPLYNFVQNIKRAEKYKLQSVRPVMVTPAIITPEAVIGSVFPSTYVALVPYSDSSFTFDGHWAPHPTYGQYGFYLSDHVLPVTGNTTRTSRLEFMTDAPIIALSTAQNGASEVQNILIWINDKLVSTSAVTYASNGSGHITKIDLTTQPTPRGPWKIRIDSNNISYANIFVSTLDRVWPVAYEDTIRVGFLGDSITEGYNATQPTTGWWNTLSDMLGWKRSLNFSKTSIGYTNNGGSFTFIDRLASIATFPLDVLVVAGGINDASSTQQQEYDAMIAFLTSAQTLLPNTKIIIVGPWTGAGASTNAPAYIYTAIKTACAAKSVDYIDTLLPTQWQFGTGRITATTGNGNSDFYISSDGVHPNQPGHDYLALRLYSAISSIISNW